MCKTNPGQTYCYTTISKSNKVSSIQVLKCFSEVPKKRQSFIFNSQAVFSTKAQIEAENKFKVLHGGLKWQHLSDISDLTVHI